MNTEEVDNKEESIRLRVSCLENEKRKLYYTRLERKLKDPDTYAVLNWILLAGLHHFYLGKYFRGSVNLLSFCIGLIFLFNGILIIGIVVIGLILVLEIYELFFSQSLIKQYNNKKSEEILSDLE